MENLRQSKLMLLQYLSGAAVLVLGGFHFALLSFAGGGYNNALQFASVTSTYLSFGLLFELLLVFLTFHVFYGFVKILTELRQGKLFEKFATWSMFLAGSVTFAWGTRTILVFLVALH